MKRGTYQRFGIISLLPTTKIIYYMLLSSYYPSLLRSGIYKSFFFTNSNIFLIRAFLNFYEEWLDTVPRGCQYCSNNHVEISSLIFRNYHVIWSFYYQLALNTYNYICSEKQHHYIPCIKTN